MESEYLGDREADDSVSDLFPGVSQGIKGKERKPLSPFMHVNVCHITYRPL